MKALREEHPGAGSEEQLPDRRRVAHVADRHDRRAAHALGRGHGALVGPDASSARMTRRTRQERGRRSRRTADSNARSAAMSAPASAGPTARARLNSMPLSAEAVAKSSFRTSWGKNLPAMSAASNASPADEAEGEEQQQPWRDGCPPAVAKARTRASRRASSIRRRGRAFGGRRCRRGGSRPGARTGRTAASRPSGWSTTSGPAP